VDLPLVLGMNNTHGPHELQSGAERTRTPVTTQHGAHIELHEVVVVAPRPTRNAVLRGQPQ
jgi:hypothetical protein